MSQPFVGEIRMFAGSFAPAGWAFCDGQLLAISENDVLFNLIGTTYGGDGQSTFGLPDLRGRLPIHQGSGFILGQTGGAESVTLTTNQIPIHSHGLIGSSGVGNDPNPQGHVLAESSAISMYSSAAPSVAMAAEAVSGTGGSQPHTNMQPCLGLNFIISLFGIFPQQN